jgi:hypothetical protein
VVTAVLIALHGGFSGTTGSGTGGIKHHSTATQHRSDKATTSFTNYAKDVTGHIGLFGLFSALSDLYNAPTPSLTQTLA